MRFLFMFELNGVCILCCKNKRNVCFMKLLQYILVKQHEEKGIVKQGSQKC